MNRLFKVLVTCCLMYQVQALADTSKTIEFQDQKEEVFNLENYLKQITMVDQEVKDTCIRKVPYEENVCRDVTKYKKECQTIPAHQECRQVNNPICHTETTTETQCHNLPSRQECHSVPDRTCSYETKYENVCHTTPDRQECRNVPEQQCHTETRYEQQCRVVVRYRQECSTVPGGQQCTTIPGRVECSVVNGENRCTKIPPSQQCTNAPSRQECRQVPYEERECSQVPRQEQVCQTVNRQQCTTIPGRYECQQVPHQEQVCRDTTRQECTTIPGDQVCNQVPVDHQVCRDNFETKCEQVPAKEECKNVPYKEQVCKMETKYKDEKYECTKVVQVPVEKLIKTHKAAVKVEFNVLSEILGPEFTVNLDTKGNVTIAAKSNDDEYYNQGTKAAVFVKKDVKVKDAGDVNNIEANYKVLMMDANTDLGYLKTPDLNAVLKKYEFTVRFNGKVDPKRATLALKIERKNVTEIDKTIAKGNISYNYVANGNYTDVTVDLKGEDVKIGSILTNSKTEYTTTVTFSQNFSDAGDMVLNKVQDFTWKKTKVLYTTK